MLFRSNNSGFDGDKDLGGRDCNTQLFRQYRWSQTKSPGSLAGPPRWGVCGSDRISGIDIVDIDGYERKSSELRTRVKRNNIKYFAHRDYSKLNIGRCSEGRCCFSPKCQEVLKNIANIDK